MFKFLEELDFKLCNRYQTVERNIKSASNSFYDAYLDMLEHYIKMVVQDNNLEIRDRETCGDLLRRSDVYSFFNEELKLDEYTYEKMKDYTRKVNQHKHKQEKNIQVDTIVSYMRIFYNVLSAYFNYKNIEIENFDADYYIKMFGIYEKENIALKDEMKLLKEELDESIELGKIKESDIEKYKNLLSDNEIKKLSLEEQNIEMSRQISKLKDIKLATLETKLDKTIDLLNDLTDSVIENRAVSYAVGDTICGRELFDKYLDSAREELKKK